MENKTKIPCPLVIFNRKISKLSAVEPTPKLLQTFNKIGDAFERLKNDESLDEKYETTYLPLQSYPIDLKYDDNLSEIEVKHIWGPFISFIDNDVILPRSKIYDVNIPYIMIDDMNKKKKIVNPINEIVADFKYLVLDQEKNNVKLVSDSSDDLSFINEFVIVIDYHVLFEKTKEAFYKDHCNAPRNNETKQPLKEEVLEIYKAMIKRSSLISVFKIVKNQYVKGLDSQYVCHLDGSCILSTNPILVIYFILTFGIKSFYYPKEFHAMYFFKFVKKFINRMVDEHERGEFPIQNYFIFLNSIEFDNHHNYQFGSWMPGTNMTYTTLNRIKYTINFKNSIIYNNIEAKFKEQKKLIKSGGSERKQKKINNQIKELERQIIIEIWNTCIYHSKQSSSGVSRIQNYECHYGEKHQDLNQQITEKTTLIIVLWKDIQSAKQQHVKPIIEEEKPQLVDDEDVVYPSCSSNEKIHQKEQKPKRSSPKKRDGVTISAENLEKGIVPPVIPQGNVNITGQLLDSIVNQIAEKTRRIIQDENEKLYEKIKKYIDHLRDDDIKSLNDSFSLIEVSTDHTPFAVAASSNGRPKRNIKPPEKYEDEQSDVSTDHDVEPESGDDRHISDLDDDEEEDNEASEDISSEDDSDDDLIEIEEKGKKPTVDIYIKPFEIYSEHNITSTKQNTMIITNHDIYRFIKEDCDDENMKRSEEEKKQMITDVLTCFMSICCLSKPNGVKVLPHGFVGVNLYIPFEYEEDMSFRKIVNGVKTDEYDIKLMTNFLNLRKQIYSNALDRKSINKMLNAISDPHLNALVKENTYEPTAMREIGFCDECRSNGDEKFKQKSLQYQEDMKAGRVGEDDPDYTPIMDYINYQDIKKTIPVPLPNMEFDREMEYCLNCNNCFHLNTRKGRKPYILISPNFEKLKPKTFEIVFPGLPKKHILSLIPLVKAGTQGSAFCSKSCEKSFNDYNMVLERFIDHIKKNIK